MLKFQENRSIFKEVRNSIGGGGEIFLGYIFWGNGVQNWIQKDVFDLYTNFHQDRSIFEKVLKFHYGGFHGAGLHPPETVHLDTKVRRVIG